MVSTKPAPQMLGSNETGSQILDGKEKKAEAAETTADSAGGRAEKQNGTTEVSLPDAGANQS